MCDKNIRPELIKIINRPLGFFALALLIVETSLATVLVFSNLTEDHKYTGMWLIVGLFTFVVLIVSILVWCKPKFLIYSEEGHLKDPFNYGTNEKPIIAEDRFSGGKKEEGNT